MKTLKNIALTVLITLSSVYSVFAGDESPTQVVGTTLVSPSMAKALFDEGVAFIDVRADADFETGRIPGAIHLNSKTVLSENALLDEVDKEERLVFYCNGVKCARSSNACKLAIEWGFTNVYYFREGMPGWKAAGYAVE